MMERKVCTMNDVESTTVNTRNEGRVAMRAMYLEFFVTTARTVKATKENRTTTISNFMKRPRCQYPLGPQATIFSPTSTTWRLRKAMLMLSSVFMFGIMWNDVQVPSNAFMKTKPLRALTRMWKATIIFPELLNTRFGTYSLSSGSLRKKSQRTNPRTAPTCSGTASTFFRILRRRDWQRSVNSSMSIVPLWLWSTMANLAFASCVINCVDCFFRVALDI
mmetsp:Transcript_26748/g.57989  ORF Transcript_26748/g.57989 Transcript_26748/m.57989 type:complete len:220 (+) Transcript_26748:835-1494(+)